jgi:hypothetical protein
MSWLREPGAEPIAGYRLIEPLGAGGFGEVWKCLAPGELLKAIKFVYGNIHSADIDAARAEQELKALQRVKEARHRSVLSLEGIYQPDGEIAIVMELADKSLHDLFCECQAAGLPGIPRTELIEYLKDAAEGLDYLNDQFHLQHLDVKPRNLFVISGHVKVADFGLVKNLERPSSAGIMAGVTPIYAAPETFNQKLSKHCDQYSLAIVYMELLTGQRPFNGKNVRQIALQHMSEAPNLDALPEADRPIVARALSKDPAKRFQNCLAFVRALAGTMEHLDKSEEASLDPPPVADDDDAPRTAVIDTRGVVKSDAAGAATAAARATQPEVIVPVRVSQPRPPGILRPTVFIGLGSFGRQALLAIRCRLLDRFGDLSHMPAVRFLYLDSDPDAVQKATAGTSDVALSPSEVFALPLQPVANYRRRMLDHLTEWLPREKLYSIPRSLQPQGNRALGRLAYCDNFLRLQARLRREVTQATDASAIAKTTRATRLPPCDAVPRAIVLASGSDGLSGILPDLGFSLRRLFDQLRVSHAPSIAIVYGGSPLDPATPALEQANLYATLMELHHFDDSSVSFMAQYGPEGPQTVDPRSPFDGVYLTVRRDRTPAAVRECVAHVATFLTHDLATPLGSRLEDGRTEPNDPNAISFRTFGTSTIWYPRGLLLRVAARRACERLLDIWRSSGQPTAPQEIDDAVAQATVDAGLHGEALLAALNDAAAVGGEGTPTEATERYLATLELQATGTDEPGIWSAQALERVRDWAGAGTSRDLESTWKKSRFFRNLQMAAAKLAEQWDEVLTTKALDVLRHSGLRLTNGEAALRKLVEFCQMAIIQQSHAIDRQYEQVKPLRDGLAAAQSQCASGGGFKLFGGGGPRALRAFVALLGQFARMRVAQDLLEAGLLFYRSLQGRLEDRIKDLGFSRQRLKALQQVLATPGTQLEESDSQGIDFAADAPMHDPFWEVVQGTETVEIVLPAGITELEQSAEQFVSSLRTEHWQQLDEELHAHVLAPLGNLLTACTGNTNLLKYLGRPLVEAAANYLADILPITDVAQVQYSASQAGKLDLIEELRRSSNAASPAMVASAPRGQKAFLLVPESDAGADLGRDAQAVVPGLQIVPTGALTESTFVREQSSLSIDEFKQLMHMSRAAYEETASQPPVSSHARFDVLEWVPLEP